MQGLPSGKGSNADSLWAYTYIKGLNDGINWDLAHKAVLSVAKGESLENYIVKTLFDNLRYL